ncbi:hypothetical protein [Streptomyces sp. HPF1205]|uniref:hypothetical protein n=1 Tax=Streptomyces sp. HPF1205 TaxID=2873262 RepID=UPI001CEC138E|nr:hypothetical protein [Streptomyces sp. HPF1205]
MIKPWGYCTKQRAIAAVGVGDGLGGFAEGAAEEVDGVALEAQADVGVHRRDDADMGVTQQLFDDDEFDALF